MIHRGTYDGTIYHNPVNRFCIISVKTADKEVPQEARSTRRYRDHLIRFVATGYELPRTDAVELELDGEWTKGKYGVQLQVEQWREIVPKTRDGVEGYLASGLIKGIGPATAAQIVSRFGVETLDILQNHPERLLEVKGITESKLEDIKTSYAESRMLQDLMTLLSPFKITPKTALKIYQHFGPASVDILKKSPFELCQVSGFGLPSLEKKELRQTGLAEWIRSHPDTDPEKYLAVWKRLPQMEQIWKAGLPRLAAECFRFCDNVRKLVLHPDEPGLIRALGLDAQKFRRLRQLDGDTETLAWLQLEKKTGQRIPDEMLHWFQKERISAKDLLFIADRMSLVQIKNYLQRQKQYFDGSCRQALTTWQDYLAMAERLHYDTSDEIVYRVRKLRQRHDELVLQSEAGSLEEQAEKMAAKYPHVKSFRS